MQGLITDARTNAGFKSNDALAQEISDRFPELADRLKTRSLGVKIGLLDKGQVTWWAKRADLTAALAQVLKLTPEDLGVHQRAEDQVFAFDEFPELPPLDLRTEAPCMLATPTKLRSQVQKELPSYDKFLDLEPWLPGPDRNTRRQHPSGLSWLQMPQGTGRSLLMAQMRARSPHEVLQVHSLAALMATQIPPLVATSNSPTLSEVR